MDLSGIISITGQSGLHKIVSQTKNGIIVEPLGGGRRFPVHGAQRVSSLEDISIYTYEEDVPLADVFASIFKNLKGGEAISHKAEKGELESFMETHLPTYDKDRVYTSDIKKVVQWYNLLLKEGLLKETEKKKETEKESSTKKAKSATSEKPKTTKKPAKKEGTAKANPKSVAKKSSGTKKMGSTRSK